MPDAKRCYPDLHDHIARLDAEGLLVRVTRAIDKDAELHPLVRWQFRGGIDEPDRKAFLFENVVDAKGKRYDIPVVVGALAANRRIYGLGIGWSYADGEPYAGGECSADGESESKSLSIEKLGALIRQRWDRAKNHP